MLDTTRPEDLAAVGRRTPRVDAAEKLTGEATYVSDMVLPGMLYARVKTSPHARARIVTIDTSRAEAIPGVRAVITGADIDIKLGLYVTDKDILARRDVRHFGEGVAAVAADTLEIAERAVEAIDVEYEELEPVLHPTEAVKPEAPLVHPELGSYSYMQAAFTPKPGTNVANHTKLRKGDIERGFAESEWIIEREYTNPSVQHVPMETHVAIVRWGRRDNVHIWSSAQSPYTLRNLFALSFKLPHRNVRVEVPYVGGGFGGKAGIGIEPLVALLSKSSGGRPVKLTATREEEFSLLPCRSQLTYTIKTGVASDGRILAQQMTMLWDSGAYADYAVNVTRASGYSAGGPYEIPNAVVDAYTVYTNKPFGTAYRGFGHVEFFWGLERHMDLVAKAIGMDPHEFRLKNTLKPGARSLTGEKITEHTGNIDACLAKAAELVGYRTQAGAPSSGAPSSGARSAAPDSTAQSGASAGSDDGRYARRVVAVGPVAPPRDMEPGSIEEREARRGRKVGRAVVGLHKAPAMPPFTATTVVVKMNEDATVTANLTLVDYGQGTYTAVAQIIAERLRMPVERVKVAFESDTDRDPYDWQTVASKGLLLSGNAAILAADDLIGKAYEDAAQVLRANARDLDHDADGIFLRHHPDSRVGWREVAIGYAYPNGNAIGGPLVGVGRYIAQGLTHLDKETGRGLPAIDWTYGAHGLVVSVDPETGEYDVLKVASVFDAGKVINPDAFRGQAIGGMVQGLGTATCEGYIYDKKGHLLNPSFTDNKIPTSKDIPFEIETFGVETAQVDGPYGARGIAEHSMIAVAAALGNAIQNATGAELTHMPLRQEDVWRALNNKAPIDNWITKSPLGSCKSAPELQKYDCD